MALVAVMGTFLSMEYSSMLVSFLTVAPVSELPRLLEDLSNMPDVHVGTTTINNRDELEASPNDKIRALADRFILLDSWQEGMERVGGGDFGFLNSKLSSEFNIRSRFTDRYCMLLLGVRLYYVTKPYDFEHMTV